jgi:hypothetical protein
MKKTNKLKGRKWSPEQRAKYKATRAANQAKRLSIPAELSDARVYLQHAVTDINKRMAAGKLKKPDRAHLMAMLALDVLGG